MYEWDLFKFFRFWLAWAVTVYATVITLQWAWGTIQSLRGRDRASSILRRYVVVQALRLRLRPLAGDLLICILLCVAFGLLWHAQSLMDDIDHALSSARRADAALVSGKR